MQLKRELEKRGITPSRLNGICIIDEPQRQMEPKKLGAEYFESQRKRLRDMLLKHGITDERFMEMRISGDAVRQSRPPGEKADDEDYLNAGLTLREIGIEVWAHHVGVEIPESVQKGDINREDADYYGGVFNPHLIKPEQQAVPPTAT